MYIFTATLVNTLLLTQIVLGAALTGLAASDSSRVLITTFGALNTIIAGVIAFLKSRGQPLRSRMFRDDLSRVVDEIENSAIMWYGISASAHGYDAIDTDEQVTVRSEVARLTRLYDKAVKTNTMNDPDMYSAGTGDSYNAGLRKFVRGGGPPAPADVPFTAPVVPTLQSPAATPAPVEAEPKPQESSGNSEGQSSESETGPTEDSAGEQEDTASKGAGNTASASGKGKDASITNTNPNPAVNSVNQMDPDESPASAARVPKKREDTQKSDRTLVESTET